ncbi:hypothetical protein CON94_08910 [Bacillus pseudomycoides]|uniref:hypothetical protein n=1 Tax=Bacillus pseudomycoides TaxID=64104 RepID=UPI000BEBADD8|nr:hypothetical protein [Bacillus pseudomycoides]PEF75625.1 hypothetical protein CON94_08910 [Bacillus pseudomycoides]
MEENSIHVENKYVFNGHLFVEFVDPSKIREEASEIIESIPDLNGKESFAKYYEKMIKNNPKNRQQLNNIFFENIMYSQLKNIFIDKFSIESNSLRVTDFKQMVKEILKEFNIKNEERIHRDILSLMSEDGFNLMDMLHVTRIGTNFISGYDFTSNNDKVQTARFLFVQVVPKGSKVGYFIAGIDINFVNGTCLTMIKNVSDIKEFEDIVENDEEDEANGEYAKSISRLYSIVNNLIIKRLIVKEKIKVETDREGMYHLCTKLERDLLGSIRDEVSAVTDTIVNDSLKKILQELFPKDNFFIKSETRSLSKQVHSLLISTYIKRNYKTKDLIKRAKELNQVGYPTRIKFVSNKSNRGSAQSGGSKVPVAATDLFHSLYTEFQSAISLELWSISWFLDIGNTSPEDCKVSQTTIYAKPTSFRVVFKQRKPINKEFINHVVGTLNQYRGE